MDTTPLPQMNYLIGLLNEETLLEHCCKFISFASTRTTAEQRALLMAKLEQDDYHEQLHRPPSPLLDTGSLTPCSPRAEFQEPLPREIKPDTLMLNSCRCCGASFVDYGVLACDDDICFYDRREEARETAIQILDKISMTIDSQATVEDT